MKNIWNNTSEKGCIISLPKLLSIFNVLFEHIYIYNIYYTYVIDIYYIYNIYARLFYKQHFYKQH